MADCTPSTQAVTDCTPSTQAVADCTPSTQVVTDPTPSTQEVSDCTPSTQAVTDPTPSTQVVTDPTPSTQVVTDPTLSTQEVSDCTPSTQEVTDCTPSTQAVTDPTPSTQVVTDPTPSTQEVTDCTPSTQAVTDPTPSTQVVTDPTLSTQEVTDCTPSTQAVTDVSQRESTQPASVEDEHSASASFTLEDIAIADSRNTCSHISVGNIKPTNMVLTVNNNQPAQTLTFQTDKNTLSAVDSISSETVENSGKSLVTEEHSKHVVTAGNNSDSKLSETDPKVEKCVIPERSENPVCHDISDSVADKQLKPLETANSDANSHLSQNANVKRYIVVKRKSLSTKDASKKPGGKLTSLLQRLTAVRSGTVAPDLSISKESGTLDQAKSLPSINTETITNTPYLSEASSISSKSVESITTKQAVSPSSSITDNSPISPSQMLQDPVTHKPILTFKISPRIDSQTSKHQVKEKSLRAQTSQSLLFKTDNIPFRTLRRSDIQPFGLEVCNNESTNLSLPQHKPPVISKTAAQAVKTGDESERCLTSAETASFVSLGQPTLFSAVKRKYVLGYVSLKDSTYIPFKEPKEHNLGVGNAHKQDPKRYSMQTNITKPNQQFSLLQNTLLKHPVSVAVNTNAKDTTKTPTIFNLFPSSSGASFSKLKLSNHPPSEAASARIPSTTPSYISSTPILDLTKLSTVPGLKLTTSPHCTASQILFQPVSYAVVTSNNTLSSVVATLALSKLTPTLAVSKSSPIKPNTSTVLTTTITSSPATTLAISTKANLKNNIPASIATVSNITTVPIFPKTLKTVNSLNESQNFISILQPLTNTQQGCSKLITKIAQRSLSHTSTNTQTRGIQSSLKSQLTQEISQPAATTTSFRIIVSRDSGLNMAAKCVSLQAGTHLPDKDGVLTSSSNTACTSDKLSMYNITQMTPLTFKIGHASTAAQSSATSQTSTTSETSVKDPIMDKNTKKPRELCPKPVTVTVSHPGNIPSVKMFPQTLKLVLPTKSKTISLLSATGTPNPQYRTSASQKRATSTKEPRMRKQSQPKAVKSTHHECVVKNNIDDYATNAVQKTSLKNVSAEDLHTVGHRKSEENTVCTTTLRTEQEPVSVLVLGSDSEDDSSDTLSDIDISNLRLPDVLKTVSADATDLVACTDDSLSQELSDLKSPKKLETSIQDIQASSTNVDDDLSNVCERKMFDSKCLHNLDHTEPDETLSYTEPDTEALNLRYSKHAGTLGQVIQQRTTSLDEEDSDVDITTTEEQDMSVLQQLLMNAVNTEQPDNSPMFCNQFDIKPRHSIKSDTDHKTHIASALFCSDITNKKSSNRRNSSQKQAASWMKSSHIGPDVTDQFIQAKTEDTSYCDLKIESIFSLSNNGDFEDTDSHTDSNVDTQVLDISNEQSPVFNVRDSDEWKDFVIPCFVVLERLSKSEMLAKRCDEILSKCSGHCRKRTLDYLCNLNLLTCVNHPEPVLFLKPMRRMAMRKQLRKITHEKINIETSIDMTMCESPLQGSTLVTSEKRELYDKASESVKNVLITPKITIQSSMASRINHPRMGHRVLPAQDDKKSEDMSSIPGVISSSLDLQFYSGLKLLQNQVDRKRAKMTDQKLSRKTKQKPLKKVKRKRVKPKSQTEPLTKKRRGSANRKKHIVKTDKATKRKRRVVKNITTNHSTVFNLPIDYSDKLRHVSSKKKVDPAIFHPNLSKINENNSGISTVSNCAVKQFPKVPIPKLRTGANIVSIKPKMQTLPAGKVKAALQSLNSYLASTGRKPTLNNTQYILLKIDDQHVLVKLPFTSVSTAQLNNVTLSGINTIVATSPVNNQVSQEQINQHVHQHMLSEADSNIAKSASKVKMSSTTAKTVSNITTSSVATAKTISNLDITSTTTQPVSNINMASATAKSVADINISPKTISNLNSAFTTANINGALFILKTNSNATLSNIAKTVSSTSTACNTAKTSLRIKKDTATKSKEDTEKMHAVSTDQRQKHHPNLRNALTSNKPIANASHIVRSLAVKRSLSAHPTAISPLQPVVSSQHQPSYSLITRADRIRKISNTTTQHNVSGNTLSTLDESGISMQVGSGNSNSLLSRLSPNSSLLPERKRMPALSKEARAIKRRRLEEKYPLPPGIVIKSEPDDSSEYESTTNLSSTSQTSFHNISTVHPPQTLSIESAITSSKHQTLPAVNSGSYLPHQGLQSQDSQICIDDLDLPVNSASNLEDMRESYENDEGSSDELDEPPALVDETTADDTGESMIVDVVDTQEDMPPILQPMFTSSYSSPVENTEMMERESTFFLPKKTTNVKTFGSNRAEQLTTTTDSTHADDSISNTSLHSDGSKDSGIDTDIPSTSTSYTSVQNSSTPAATKSTGKSLKIQHLKELLKKKELEIENMKKMRFEFPSLDLDSI